LSVRSPSSVEEPLLPPTYDVNALRSAVGASPLVDSTGADRQRRPSVDRDDDDDDDDDDESRPRNRKAVLVAAASLAVGVAIATLVILGHLNSGRYLLACEAERAVAEQGRTFPPWGTHALDGEAWKPVKIAPETRCQPRETDDVLVLERLYLAMLLDQATGLLTAREVTRVDDAEVLLKQALLLTRPPADEPAKLAAERSEHHKEIEQLLGDVGYWRAQTKLRDAAAALTDAAKQLDAAAAQHPRHVSDAPAWASYARRLAGELHAGPAGGTPTASAPGSSTVPATPAAPAAERPNAPAGTALPVEPDNGSASEPSPATPPTVDAGVPTGGVLL
jgi:hypothetical protein